MSRNTSFFFFPFFRASMVAEECKTFREIPEKSSPNGRMKRRPKMLQV